jgi:cytidine deaminase
LSGFEAERLVAAARAAREHAVAPYSGFRVGAAILCASGRVVTGCNVENATYGLTVCAERVALLKALSEGERAFRAVAVVTDSPAPTPPCGACRQLLWEYCRDVPVLLATLSGGHETRALADLYPMPFDERRLS